MRLILSNKQKARDREDKPKMNVTGSIKQTDPRDNERREVNDRYG